MSRWLTFTTLLATSAFLNEIDGLVTPRYLISHRLQHSPSLSRDGTRQHTIHQKNYKPTKSSTKLSNTATDLEEITDGLPDDDFQPRTMKVLESFSFFARFTAKTILEKRAQRSQGTSKRRRLRRRLKQMILRRKDEASNVNDSAVKTKTTDDNYGIRGSIRKLNESRKNLTSLVGYDSSLLLPAFSYLILGALMSSIVPHFYSACISCVVGGEPNQAKLLWAIGGLGLSHMAEALFTGFRGALFWIAGEFCFCA